LFYIRFNQSRFICYLVVSCVQSYCMVERV